MPWGVNRASIERLQTILSTQIMGIAVGEECDRTASIKTQKTAHRVRLQDANIEQMPP